MNRLIAGLRQSPHIKAIRLDDGNWVQYHRLFGQPLILSERERALFCSLPPECEDSDYSLYNTEETTHTIQVLVESFHLIKESIDERTAIRSLRDEFALRLSTGDLCNALSLVVSEGCNFNCKHCLPNQVANTFHTKLTNAKLMTFVEAKFAIDEFVELVRERDEEFQIFFGGREPLTNWKTIELAMEYAASCFASIERKIVFIMFTNCSLLTPEIVRSLRKHNVLIAVSLDGLKEDNDRRRPASAGKSSFEMTLRGWQMLRDADLLDRCFNCTVAGDDVGVLSDEFLDFVIEQQFNTVSLNPDETSLTLESAVEFLSSLLAFNETAYLKGIHLTGQWRMVFENLFRNVSNSINTGFCSAYTGHSVTVRPGGGYSLCSPDPRRISAPIALLDHLASPEYANSVVPHFVGEMDFCKGCDIEGFCMGGCGVAEDVANLTSGVPAAKCIVFRGMFEKLLVDAATLQLTKSQSPIRFPLSVVKQPSAWSREL